MPVKIAVLKETRPHERRVALVPVVAEKLVKLGAELHMQAGAGAEVKLPDSAYKSVQFAADPKDVLDGADVLLAVQTQPQQLDQPVWGTDAGAGADARHAGTDGIEYGGD